MTTSKSHQNLFNQRIQLILENSTSSCYWESQDPLEKYLERIFDENSSPNPILTYWTFKLAWTAQYPENIEHNEIKNLLLTLSRNEFSKVLYKKICTEQNWKFNEKNLLVSLKSNKGYWVDVTHTFSFNAVTGIQKVVYFSAENWTKKERPASLFRFNSLTDSPEALSNSEVLFFNSRANLLHRSSNKNAKPNLISILNFIFEKVVINSIKLIFSRSQFRDKLIFFARKVKSEKTKRLREWIRNRKSKKETNKTRSLPILLGKRVVITELLLEPERIQFYMDISEADPSFKLSLVVHDLIPIYRPELFVSTTPFINYLRLLRIADKISTTTTSVQNEVNSFLKLAPSHRTPEVKVIGLATRFSSVNTITQPEATPALNIPTILCVGTLEPRKNHIDIIQACLKLHLMGHRFKLLFIGGIGWNFEGILQTVKLAKKSGLNLEVLSGLNDSELQSHYQNCAFTVFYSVAEGFGLPVLESVAAGKTCIAADIPAIREISEQYGGCILVKPNSPNDLALAIENQLNGKNEAPLRRNITVKTWEEYSDELFEFFSCQTISNEAKPS